MVTAPLGGRGMVAHAPLRPTPFAEQSMAMPALPPDFASRHWTVEEVVALNEASTTTRYECIDGELLVTSGPTIGHQVAAGRLYRVLADYLDVQRIGYPLFAPLDVQLTDDSLMQPDLMVVPLRDGRPPRTGDHIDRLVLAIEILSPSSRRGDRVTKRRLHKRAGTPEYWIVDAEARAIERWRPADERPEVVDGMLEWHPDGATAPLRLDVGALLAD